MNDSLLMRKEGALLVLVNSFMKKVMNLSLRENISNQNKGLLVYCIITYLQQLHEIWNITPLATKYKNLSQALPADALKKLDDLARKSNNNEPEKILALLQGVGYMTTEDQKSEHESVMQMIITHLRSSYPNQKFEHLDEEFDELDNIYAGTNFVSVAGKPNLEY